MRVHFIAVGGSAMHNLALALHQKGYNVSGSDDEIFEPSRSRLQAAGILPDKWGWFPEKITPELDAVILGMHAREDNPELQRALELGLKIYSYPEYLYEQTKDKKRIIVGGSHGKTTTTSMIMHVLRHCGIKFDYMVGALLDGFDTMVHLSSDSKIAVFEGDEYLSSPLDPRPKFHHYYPDIAVLTGIAWDHMNVFPTMENYTEQFALFLEKISDGGSLIFFENDEEIRRILHRLPAKVRATGYGDFPHVSTPEGIRLLAGTKEVPLRIFGRHNMQNLSAAWLVCREVGISEDDFLEAISDYEGASKRLQKIAEGLDAVAFLDFAHSPSKLKATVSAVKERFPDRKIIAVMELHTFSSLNADFLPQYKNCMQDAGEAIVYFNPEVVIHKKLPPISPEDVKKGFNDPTLKVFTDNRTLREHLKSIDFTHSALLIMTSGNFSGIDIKKLAQELLNA